MNLVIDPCYLCARFVRQPDAQPGYGMCHGFDKPRRYDDTNAACALWNEAKNVRERRGWAGKQER